MYKYGLALNNLQLFICNKVKQNQTKLNPIIYDKRDRGTIK